MILFEQDYGDTTIEAGCISNLSDLTGNSTVILNQLSKDE